MPETTHVDNDCQFLDLDKKALAFASAFSVCVGLNLVFRVCVGDKKYFLVVLVSHYLLLFLSNNILASIKSHIRFLISSSDFPKASFESLVTDLTIFVKSYAIS